RGRHLRRADLPADVPTVEPHDARRGFETYRFQPFGQPRALDRLRAIAEERIGDGPVHRPGVEELEAEAPGQRFGRRALARVRRPVDGDNHPSPPRANNRRNAAWALRPEGIQSRLRLSAAGTASTSVPHPA